SERSSEARRVKQSGRACRAPASCFPSVRNLLVETSRRVGQHGVDFTGLRGEIGTRYRLAPLVMRNLVEQALELGDVTVDSLHEFAVGAILAPDLFESPLALHGIELAGEHVALPALVTVPQLGRGVMVDHARDIDRNRIERLDRLTLNPGWVR